LSDSLDWFNVLPADQAEDLLYACFANKAWATRLTAGRPYRDLSGLMEAADSAWSELSDADWVGAFAAHPRIGERGGHAPATSEREQSRVMQSSEATLRALAAENREYEAHFGYIFLISAAGRGAKEVLAELRLRMKNEPSTELKVAAGEQRKITRLRLEKLLNR
jgi:OHCU decarboxylase